MLSNVKWRLRMTFHPKAEHTKPPTDLQNCWTETYFYANSVDKCVVIGLPFLNGFELSHWIELYCELSYNCIFIHDLCAHWGPVCSGYLVVVFLQLVWLQTLQDVSPPVNINLYHCPPHWPLSVSSLSFSFICSFSFFHFYLLSLIPSVLFSFSFPVSDAFTYCSFSIIYLGSIWRDNSKAPSGLYSCSASLVACTRIVFFFLSLHLALTHSLPRQDNIMRLLVACIFLYRPSFTCLRSPAALWHLQVRSQSSASLCGIMLRVPGWPQSHRLLTFGMMSHNGRAIWIKSTPSLGPILYWQQAANLSQCQSKCAGKRNIQVDFTGSSLFTGDAFK